MYLELLWRLTELLPDQVLQAQLTVTPEEVVSGGDAEVGQLWGVCYIIIIIIIHIHQHRPVVMEWTHTTQTFSSVPLNQPIMGWIINCDIFTSKQGELFSCMLPIRYKAKVVARQPARLLGSCARPFTKKTTTKQQQCLFLWLLFGDTIIKETDYGRRKRKQKTSFGKNFAEMPTVPNCLYFLTEISQRDLVT